MKKITLALCICLIAVLLTACKGGDKMSYSVTVRNAGSHEIMLKNIAVNNRTYMVQETPLAAYVDKGSSDYLAVFGGGRSISVNVEIYDEILGKTMTFAEQFTDKSGEGCALLVEYSNGAFRSEVSRVGRLSAWGSP